MKIETKLKDYLSNKIPYQDIINYLDEIIDFLEEKYYSCVREGLINHTDSNHDFRFLFKSILKCEDTIQRKSTFYDEVYEILNKSGVYNAKSSNQYSKIFDFCLEYIPEYLLSDETSVVIEKKFYPFISQLKTKKDIKNFVKEKCHELFHLDNGKRPYWVQESEWPVRNNIPCKYIGRKRNGDKVTFKFVDVVDDQNVYIIQYY